MARNNSKKAVQPKQNESEAERLTAQNESKPAVPEASAKDSLAVARLKSENRRLAALEAAAREILRTAVVDFTKLNNALNVK